MTVLTASSTDTKKKHFQLIEKTYRSNTESDYTEKIEHFGKNFDYSSNSNYYWGDPKFSTLYGTPLYEAASPSQKLALNHLYWVGQYNHTANAEANTMLYNQITTGVFATVKGYENLCQELDFETFQERFHINTFQKIGYKTKIALLGKEALGNPIHKRSQKSIEPSWYEKLVPKSLQAKFATKWTSSTLPTMTDSVLRSFNKLAYGGGAKHYSRYLADRENAPIPTTTGGLAGYTASPAAFKFLSLNWGSSPFMACQYYSMRMVANMSLKAYEYQYHRRYRDLVKEGEFIPTPTAVSFYHLLDESFHTTMSQTIAQEVYKDFPKPTVYEKLLANAIVLRGQQAILGGLSGWLPATFRNDSSYMTPLYRLLQSPLFGMSSSEALHWMEKCLCQEHEGFHANLKHHQNLLSDFRRFLVASIICGQTIAKCALWLREARLRRQSEAIVRHLLNSPLLLPKKRTN